MLPVIMKAPNTYMIIVMLISTKAISANIYETNSRAYRAHYQSKSLKQYYFILTLPYNTIFSF